MGANVKRTEPKLWPLKLHYFLHGAGTSKPFKPLFGGFCVTLLYFTSPWLNIFYIAAVHEILLL